MKQSDAGMGTTQGRAAVNLREYGFACSWVAWGKLLNLSGLCSMRSIWDLPHRV